MPSDSRHSIISPAGQGDRTGLQRQDAGMLAHAAGAVRDAGSVPQLSVPNRDAVLRMLQTELAGLLAVHAFGSRVHGTARADSDLDLAVLVEGRLDVVRAFDLAGRLADIVGCPVDLVDLRAASTVMQYQIIVRGERWWSAGLPADLFELFVLDEKMNLDEARAGLLQDIRERGRVYGG